MVESPAVVSLADLKLLVGAIPDPEVPVLSIADLGVLRSVTETDGVVTVTLTPTYSGCPAIEFIEDSVRKVVANAGYPEAQIETSFSPAWTTEWMSEAGKEKLTAYGIAPPLTLCEAAGTASGSVATVSISARSASKRPRIGCPLCGSNDTRIISEFGSTACKALYSCNECREPFDYFKEI